MYFRAKVQRELSGRSALGRSCESGTGVSCHRRDRAPVSIGMDFDEVVEIPVEMALRVFNCSGLFRILLRSGPVPI